MLAFIMLQERCGKAQRRMHPQCVSFTIHHSGANGRFNLVQTYIMWLILEAWCRKSTSIPRNPPRRSRASKATKSARGVCGEKQAKHTIVESTMSASLDKVRNIRLRNQSGNQSSMKKSTSHGTRLFRTRHGCIASSTLALTSTGRAPELSKKRRRAGGSCDFIISSCASGCRSSQHLTTVVRSNVQCRVAQFSRLFAARAQDSGRFAWQSTRARYARRRLGY